MIAKTLLLLRQLLSERGWRTHAHEPLAEIPESLTWAKLSELRKESVAASELREAILNLCWKLEQLCLKAAQSRLHIAPNERTNQEEYCFVQYSLPSG